jgi:hypothetical protein
MPATEGLIAGGIEAVGGAITKIAANRRLKRLSGQRVARQTPQEFIDANNLALNEAQTGYGASSLDYFTSQSDRALTASLETVSRLGGDPNSIADIFDRNMQSIMKTTNDDALLKYQKTSRVFDSLYGLGEQRLANWADKEAVLKDKMAAEAMKVKAGADTMNSGLNLAFSSFTAMKAGSGYDSKALPSYSTDGGGSFAAQPLQRTGIPAMQTGINPRTSPDVILNSNWYQDYLRRKDSTFN